MPNELERVPVEQMIDVLARPREKIVDADDVVAPGKQPVAEMRPDEACTAGYQNALSFLHETFSGDQPAATWSAQASIGPRAVGNGPRHSIRRDLPDAVHGGARQLKQTPEPPHRGARTSSLPPGASRRPRPAPRACAGGAPGHRAGAQAAPGSHRSRRERRCREARD